MRPTSEEFLEIFQIDVTFVKEAAVYSQIVPAMIKLQQEMGLPENEMIDVFCRCYNTRVSLDPASDKVDADGVMLFENLKLAGFITEDRRQGFSRELGEFILNVCLCQILSLFSTNVCLCSRNLLSSMPFR